VQKALRFIASKRISVTPIVPLTLREDDNI
jgi:hypothetical protein